MNVSLRLLALSLAAGALLMCSLPLVGCGGGSAPPSGGAGAPPAPVPPGEDEMKGAMDQIKAKAGAKAIPGLPRK